MYYCILTDCANLDLNSKIDRVKPEIYECYKSPEEFKFQLGRQCFFWKNESDDNENSIEENSRDFHSPEKTKYINDKVDDLKFEELIHCSQLTLNYDCCRIFIYKTKNPKRMTLSQKEVLLIFNNLSENSELSDKN